MGKWMSDSVLERPELEMHLPVYLRKDLNACVKGAKEGSSLMD